MTWQSMETAPKDGTWVLATNGEGLPVIVQFSQYGKGWQTMDEGPYTALTHWMPLPAPPAVPR